MSAADDWRPGATLPVLKLRATLLAEIRSFMAERGVLEVETPSLCRTTTTDPWIDSLCVDVDGRRHWLRTSPEHHMKRLLAAGAPDIYQLGRVFRADPAGAQHQPEFTLLEWYRLGSDDHTLMRETCALLHGLAATADRALEAPHFTRYAEAFASAGQPDPLAADLDELIAAARALPIWRDELEASLGSERTVWLDLLLSHAVLPSLPLNRLIVLHDYPAEQAALARISDDDPRVAQRFEVLLDGIELANGYAELTDAREQRRRAAADNRRRLQLGLGEVAVDEALLGAIAAGLPACAGVAVGIDRTLMALTGIGSIDAVTSFIAGS